MPCSMLVQESQPSRFIMEFLLPSLSRALSRFWLRYALRCTEATIMEKTMAASAAIAYDARLTRTLEALQMNCVVSRRGLSLTKEDRDYHRLTASGCVSRSVEREGHTVRQYEDQSQDNPETEQLPDFTFPSAAQDISAMSLLEVRSLEEEARM
ncbi:unnamed protein product [Cylicostephanus goldi]|uniref:Uncharacterized protein n=1 Tax=Cylicostephanus goldi TaxID=71465 RepID=A0A3P6TH37_CYLGO|nr:unnamed protein product [Cylicostephanus goldi]